MSLLATMLLRGIARLKCTLGWRTAALVLLLVSLLSVLNGCIPMIPVPSPSEQPPYSGELLEFLRQKDISRADVEAEFGAPPISRLDGQVLIYGMAREKGGRLLIIAPPMIPMTIPDEELNFLFLEFDERGLLTHQEVAVNGHRSSGLDPTLGFHCSSRGVCVAGEGWKVQGAFPLWAESGEMTERKHTVVTAPYEMEAEALRLQAPDRGCAVYFLPVEAQFGWVRSIGRTAKSVSYSIDGGQKVFGGSYYYGSPEPVFARWRLDPGRHVVSATGADDQPVAEYEFVCTDGTLRFVAGENLPTIVGSGPKARFIELTREEAELAFRGRRMLLDR